MLPAFNLAEPARVPPEKANTRNKTNRRVLCSLMLRADNGTSHVYHLKISHDAILLQSNLSMIARPTIQLPSQAVHDICEECAI